MNEEKYVIFIEHEHEKEKLFPTLMEINPTKICNFRIKSETYKWSIKILHLSYIFLKFNHTFT